MKKVIGQTVRDLKREVNKKVLKVPGIEQKVLDATSNEPWGPHGSLLADIAMATRNYHEYQMIMAVVWKRINDTGKNWRHVYKGLTVLEYLVAHGSERVIDEIREHSHQISMLSDFQYIDSSGRDQGSNVRKKSQSLVALVNDKERIIEVRQKAAANRDKFRNTSMGGMYRPGSGGYGDKYDYDRYEGRYGSRDEDQSGYGYGREREYGYRDDDRYGRYGDRYERDYEDRSSRDGYRDDNYRGRNRDDEDFQYGSRSRSSDRDRAYDDDGQSSARGSGVRAEDQSQDGSQHERKFSEQNIGAPPSYEEAMSESRSPIHSERNGETSVASAPGAVSPASNNPNHATLAMDNSISPVKESDAFDEFDPRSSTSVTATASSAATAAASFAATAAPTASTTAEFDLLGSLSDSFSSNALAIVPTSSTGEIDAHANPAAVPTVNASQSATSVANQPFEDPFGDGPFRATPSMDTAIAQEQASSAVPSFQPTMNQNGETTHPAAINADVTNFKFGDSFSAITYSASSISGVQPASTNSQFLPQELSTPNQETDILADILPPSGPSHAVASQTAFSAPTNQPAQPGSNMYGQPPLPASNIYGQPALPGNATYAQPIQPSASLLYGQPAQPTANSHSQPLQPSANAYVQQPHPSANAYGQLAHQSGNPYGQLPQPSSNPYGQQAQPSANPYGSFNPQSGSMAPFASKVAPQLSSGLSAESSSGSFSHGVSTAPVNPQIPLQPQLLAGPASQLSDGNFPSQQGSASPVVSQNGPQATNIPTAQQNDVLGNLFSQPGPTSVVPQSVAPSSSGSLAVVPQASKEKFEPKSSVWADTLSRGLVNLNISGPKINPLADIGIDFDAINRKEKRMEKPVATPVTSTVTMGKAMGSGSGMGRAGASALRPPPNPMMGSGMGMGMGMGMGGGPGGGMGMGGYGGVHMQPQTGMPARSTMPGNYNPMMGSGGYFPQQPYGGGYQ
ncbi:hypothetical protein SLE2022_143580 [Rubroshorea leprosula]